MNERNVKERGPPGERKRYIDEMLGVVSGRERNIGWREGQVEYLLKKLGIRGSKTVGLLIVEGWTVPAAVLPTLALEIPLSHCTRETGCEVGGVAVEGNMPSESRQAEDQADSEYQTGSLI